MMCELLICVIKYQHCIIMAKCMRYSG
uniref:Uncharacterized protein n=1 Tax=Arundo donax TaxID=35708 RepID=A0A0A9ALT6_ARUDO